MTFGQKLRLHLADGSSVEARWDGRDVRAWEAKFNRPAINVPQTYSMQTFYGWSAAKRDGTLNGEYDKYEAFDAVCVSIDFLREETEDEADPTEPASDTPREASGD